MEFMMESDAAPYEESSNFGSGKNEKQNGDVIQEDRRLSPSFNDPSYDMSGDKILIIFNHFKYKKPLGIRRGTYSDVKILEQTFRRLGFVVVTHDDWTYKEIMKYLSDVCAKDHSNTSCVAVAIMTHGTGVHVHAADRLYPVADVTDAFRTVPTLVGKPKLFFIQDCRADHTTSRRQNLEEESSISVDADSLVLYSCYEDYVSYRQGTGTWLMQNLCKVVDRCHESMDLVQMILLINQLVASRTTEFGNKQMPVTEYNLTKLLML